MSRLLAIVLLAVSTLTGCVLDPDLDEVLGPFESRIGAANLQPDLRVRLGRGLLLLAKGVMAVSAPGRSEEITDLLRDVDEMHLGVYTVARNAPPPGPALEAIGQELVRDGWVRVGESRDARATAVLFGQVDDDDLRELLVIIWERDELLLAKLEGNLSTVLDSAVRTTMRSPHEVVRSIRDAVARATHTPS